MNSEMQNKQKNKLKKHTETWKLIPNGVFLLVIYFSRFVGLSLSSKKLRFINGMFLRIFIEIISIKTKISVKISEKNA